MKIQDFIGFSFNKQHSSDFNIIRTSDGSRYNTNLTPNLTDKTADVPGGDGQYYFTSFHKNRTFNINFAFDALSEMNIRKLRKWLSGKEVGDLIFDEEPYKAYSAKVTGAPTLKALCFDDEYGRRVYKGEGSITFTCYYPYAHTPDWVWSGNDSDGIG
jgi:predicted phage tail component-like protein